MSLIIGNSHIRRIGILTTTSTIAAIGFVYLCWKLFHRRAQVQHKKLMRDPSVDDWENAMDTPIRDKETLPTPQQLYKYGLEHLNLSIDSWQRALNMIEISLNNQTTDRINQNALIELKEKVEYLLNKIDVSSNCNELASISRREQANLQILPIKNSSYDNQFFPLNRQESNRVQREIRTAMSVQSDLNTFNDRRSLRSFRSTDSFQSCNDDADWIDTGDLLFDSSSPYYSLPSFYVYGLRIAEKNQVPYRKLRTKLLRCSSDTDYLAKLYCIRNACDELLGNDEKKEFLKRISRAICERFLEKASKDTTRFIHAFEHMNKILADEQSWSMINDELIAAGIKSATVYNVGIDFMLLEGFEILDSPPSAMRTILQNRWLSEGFREQALNKAVSYALKIRRATAKNPDGFLTTFLSLIEDMTPIFAWGILGPDSSVKPICTFLKDCVLDFARSLYDLDRTDYSSLTALTKDIDRQMNNLLRTIVEEFEIDPTFLSYSPSLTVVRFT